MDFKNIFKNNKKVIMYGLKGVSYATAALIAGKYFDFFKF